MPLPYDGKCNIDKFPILFPALFTKSMVHLDQEGHL